MARASQGTSLLAVAQHVVAGTRLRAAGRRAADQFCYRQHAGARRGSAAVPRHAWVAPGSTALPLPSPVALQRAGRAALQAERLAVTSRRLDACQAPLRALRCQRPTACCHAGARHVLACCGCATPLAHAAGAAKCAVGGRRTRRGRRLGASAPCRCAGHAERGPQGRWARRGGVLPLDARLGGRMLLLLLLL